MVSSGLNLKEVQYFRRILILNTSTINKFAILVVAAIFLLPGCDARWGYVPPNRESVSVNRVGTKPGDVGVSTDIDKAAASRKHELATFAQGCFWHSEEAYRKIPGVVATAVGYSGGTVANPSYEQVTSHTTRHAETILVEFDPKMITYRQLLADFFNSHDPTTIDRQGPDVGDSYRSVIFYRNPAQKKAAEQTIEQLKIAKKISDPIVTQLVPAASFYLAEEYHQQYFEKAGN